MSDRCHVCGAGPLSGESIHRQNGIGKPGIWACDQHMNVIRCSIEGCRRTKNYDKPTRSEWICAEHWRRYCPPRSARRRAYLAFFRKAKRYGWNDELNTRFWRFWDMLVASANARRDAGAIDISAIHKMFGWDE